MHRDVRIPVVAVFVATIVFGIGLTRAQEEANDAGDAGDHIKRGLFTTALGEGDLLVEIELPPMPDGAGWAFDEVSRRHGDRFAERTGIDGPLGKAGWGQPVVFVPAQIGVISPDSHHIHLPIVVEVGGGRDPDRRRGRGLPPARRPVC